MQHISDMSLDDKHVEAVLVVAALEMRSFSSKPGQYLWLKLRDKSGEIEGKIWDVPDGFFEKIGKGSALRVKGKLSKWRDRLDLTIDSAQVLAAGEVDPRDFLPTCPRSVEEMWSELLELVKLVTNRHMRAILDEFIGDEKLRELFCRAPGSCSWHHGYIGGLLEHTVAVASLCRDMAKQYDEVDLSLLICGAIFHDIGKVDDYRCDTIIEHSFSGRFIGHIVSGYHRLCQLAASLGDFPDETLILLGHIIVSHHRKEEWGSPQRPKCLEAQLVHYADNLDAQSNGCNIIVKRGRESGDEWSHYNRLLGTDIFCRKISE